MTEILQERAALYVSGAMTASERDRFELVLEFDQDLRRFVASLAEVGCALTLAALNSRSPGPTPGLKTRVFDAIRARQRATETDGLVRCGADGLVQWINPAFTAICGYSLGEVAGRKLGPILQGAKTDRATAERMRRAVRECRPCCETLVNYHKNGTPYRVEIAIEPILDNEGRPLFLVARERELPECAVA